MFNKTITRPLALLALFAFILAGVSAAAGATPLSPMGTEFRINERVEGGLATGGLAMNADGDAVAVWFDTYDTWTIQARLIDKTGQVHGNQFAVATYGTGDLRDSEVAMDADGNFVVVWEGVYMRRFGASGNALAAPQQVSSTSKTADPQIAMAPDGQFVVVWGRESIGTLVGDVMVRLYHTDGSPRTDESTVVTGGEDFWSLDVAMDRDGNFVVSYVVELANGSQTVRFQRYDENGVAQGAAVDIGYMITPQIAMDGDGNFVIVYAAPDADSLGIWMRRFDAAGNELGQASPVNTTTDGAQGSPVVAMTDNGDFYVVWTCDYVEEKWQYEAGRGVHGRHFSASGQPLSDEFKVNTYPAGAPYEPLVAIDDEGDTLTVWASYMQDGFDYGLYGQWNKPEDPAIPMLFSFHQKGKVAGIRYQPVDILRYDPASNDWSLVFDGSDHKIRGNLTGLAVLPGGDWLMSFSRPVKLPGIGKLMPQDIARFDPVAELWSLYFDGSDVELTRGSEGLDAVAIDRDGSLLLSTKALMQVSGLSFHDEDIVRFTPTSLGEDTQGTWSKVLNGIWYGNYKDLWALWSDTVSQDDYLYMTFARTITLDGGNLKVPNGSVLRCAPSYPEADGSYHGCNLDVYWDGQAAGLDKRAKIDGFAMLTP